MRSRRFKECVAEFINWRDKSAWKLVPGSDPPEVDMNSKPTYRYPTEKRSTQTKKAPKMSRMQITDDDEVYINPDTLILHEEDDNQVLDDFVDVPISD